VTALGIIAIIGGRAAISNGILLSRVSITYVETTPRVVEETSMSPDGQVISREVISSTPATTMTTGEILLSETGFAVATLGVAKVIAAAYGLRREKRWVWKATLAISAAMLALSIVQWVFSRASWAHMALGAFQASPLLRQVE
jgi:hypothetical protein